MSKEKSAGELLAELLTEKDENKKKEVEKAFKKSTEDFFKSNGANFSWGDKENE
jgi:hypothetical protein